MRHWQKTILAWLPPVFWMGLIFFLSSFHKLQASSIPWEDFITRKTAHFLEYTVLYFLYYRSFKKTTRYPLSKILVLSLVLTVLYAFSDEYHQTWVTGRTGRPFDVGVDSCGAIFGALFSWKILNLLPEKIRKVIL